MTARPTNALLLILANSFVPLDPVIFQSVQQKLGLKLEVSRAPIEMLAHIVIAPFERKSPCSSTCRRRNWHPRQSDRQPQTRRHSDSKIPGKQSPAFQTLTISDTRNRREGRTPS